MSRWSNLIWGTLRSGAAPDRTGEGSKGFTESQVVFLEWHFCLSIKWPVATKLCIYGWGGGGVGVEEGRRARPCPLCCHNPVWPRSHWAPIIPRSKLDERGPSHISHGCPCRQSEPPFLRQSVLNQVLCFGRGMEPSFLILLLWESASGSKQLNWWIHFCNMTYMCMCVCVSIHTYTHIYTHIHTHAEDCLFQV